MFKRKIMYSIIMTAVLGINSTPVFADTTTPSNVQTGNVDVTVSPQIGNTTISNGNISNIVNFNIPDIYKQLAELEAKVDTLNNKSTHPNGVNNYFVNQSNDEIEKEIASLKERVDSLQTSNHTSNTTNNNYYNYSKEGGGIPMNGTSSYNSNDTTTNTNVTNNEIGDAEKIIENGWYWVNDRWYFRQGGSLVKDWYKDADGNWYYLGNDGVMRDGWLIVDGNKYYMKTISDGTRGSMLKGHQLIDGIWYEFDSNGKLIEGISK